MILQQAIHFWLIRKSHHTWISAAKLHMCSNNYTIPQTAIAQATVGDLNLDQILHYF